MWDPAHFLCKNAKLCQARLSSHLELKVLYIHFEISYAKISPGIYGRHFYNKQALHKESGRDKN